MSNDPMFDYVKAELASGQRGGFAAAIAEAWFLADSINRAQLEASFPRLFESGHKSIADALASHFTKRFGAPVRSEWDEDEKAYCIRGENLVPHPDMQDTYPNGWSLMSYVPPSRVERILQEGA